MNSARLTVALLLLAAILAGVVPTILRSVVQIVMSATTRAPMSGSRRYAL